MSDLDRSEPVSREFSPIAPALQVLSAARDSVAQTQLIYETDTEMRSRFCSAVNTIGRSLGAQGKLVITGVGKSGYIGRKLVATCNSLGLQSGYLHPSEAMHGDLGFLMEKDVVLMVSNSGRTPELQKLLVHIQPAIPLIIISGTSDCELAEDQADRAVLLLLKSYDEKAIPGIPAPTTSTIAALALGYALALSSACCLHRSNLAAVFYRNHPGGAIGMSSEAGRRTSSLKPASRL